MKWITSAVTDAPLKDGTVVNDVAGLGDDPVTREYQPARFVTMRPVQGLFRRAR